MQILVGAAFEGGSGMDRETLGVRSVTSVS